MLRSRDYTRSRSSKRVPACNIGTLAVASEACFHVWAHSIFGILTELPLPAAWFQTGAISPACSELSINVLYEELCRGMGDAEDRWFAIFRILEHSVSFGERTWMEYPLIDFSCMPFWVPESRVYARLRITLMSCECSSLNTDESGMR